MKTNRRDFLKNISQGAVAVSVMPGMVKAQKNVAGSAPVPGIKKVHMIFKHHLDIGFTASARKITKNLWDWKIPAEIAAARTLEKEGMKPAFLYGSWVVWEALEKSKGEKLSELERAIEDNIVTWGGFAFTPESEYFNDSLFDSMTGISKTLDQRFGKNTIAAKATDVPGHTIGIVPHFAKAGIKFLHIGVNWASPVPEVPDVFIWKHTDGSELITMYLDNYGGPQGVEGHDEYLGLMMKGDNMDPWTALEVRDAFDSMKKKFPDAAVEGSSLNNFAMSLEKIRKKLPVVTQELGDSWIYGFGADPLKTSKFRELCRLHKKWLQSGDADEKTLEKFSVYLSLVGEHTWGMDHDTYLDDKINIPADLFKKARTRSNFRMLEESWREQREYIDMAVESLPENLSKQATESLEKLKAVQPDLTKYITVSDNNKEFVTPFFKIKLGSNGAITGLTEISKHKIWFDGQHPLGLFQYQTFSGTDLFNYNSKYWKGIVDTDKSVYERYDAMGAAGKMWQPAVRHVFERKDNKDYFLMAEMVMPDEAHTKFGAPAKLFIEYHFPGDKAEINIRLQWFDKPACRFSEASWLSVVPVSLPTDIWRMEKIDSMLSPMNVASKGGRNLHGIWEKITCQGKQTIQIETLDACLFSPGKPAVYDFHNQVPDMRGGAHFNLHNNTWVTNSRAWYDDDALFRFKVSFV